ncbi:MAG: nucleotidyltransferase protein [Chloroflexi bacterium]|nr:nucleotidyltransferase protein [Chloroflexota bacterium]
MSSVRVVFPPYSRAELIERLRADVPALSAALPLERVVLFGSWAHGRATASSDVDLLVVYRAPKRDDAYEAVLHALSVRRVEPHVYTVDEAEQLEDVLGRMARGGVELFPVAVGAPK